MSSTSLRCFSLFILSSALPSGLAGCDAERTQLLSDGDEASAFGRSGTVAESREVSRSCVISASFSA